MNEFELSYYSSVIIQFLSLIIQGYGYTLNVVPSLHTLKYALNIEFFVSLIEIVVYIWIGTNLGNYSSVMKKRYIDWFITTNALMVSFSLLFIFFYQQKEEVQEEPLPLNKILHRNISKYVPILSFNTLMLVCGYLGEINYFPKMISVSTGFFFFFLSFYYLYKFFAKYTMIGTQVLYGLAIIWSLYGLAHIFSEKWKNVSYNILDLISKNAFGVILVYMLLSYKN